MNFRHFTLAMLGRRILRKRGFMDFSAFLYISCAESAMPGLSKQSQRHKPNLIPKTGNSRKTICANALNSVFSTIFCPLAMTFQDSFFGVQDVFESCENLAISFPFAKDIIF